MNVTLFDTLTFNQQNCQHPELHTPAPCSIRPRIDMGSKSCRTGPSFLQLQIAAHVFPAARQRQLITSTRAGGPVGPGSIHYTVKGRQPSSPIRRC